MCRWFICFLLHELTMYWGTELLILSKKWKLVFRYSSARNNIEESNILQFCRVNNDFILHCIEYVTSCIKWESSKSHYGALDKTPWSKTQQNMKIFCLFHQFSPPSHLPGCLTFGRPASSPKYAWSCLCMKCKLIIACLR